MLPEEAQSPVGMLQGLPGGPQPAPAAAWTAGCPFEITQSLLSTPGPFWEQGRHETRSCT